MSRFGGPEQKIEVNLTVLRGAVFAVPEGSRPGGRLEEQSQRTLQGSFSALFSGHHTLTSLEFGPFFMEKRTLNRHLLPKEIVRWPRLAMAGTQNRRKAGSRWVVLLTRKSGRTVATAQY